MLLTTVEIPTFSVLNRDEILRYFFLLHRDVQTNGKKNRDYDKASNYLVDVIKN